MPPLSFAMVKLMSLAVALAFLLVGKEGVVAIYTKEPPVKMLYVESVATRYPAAESEYRISLNGSHVSKVH